MARWPHPARFPRQLRQLLGLADLPDDHPYTPYARLAREWRDDHMAQLAATVAGGAAGPGPASVVSTAALQLGASRYLRSCRLAFRSAGPGHITPRSE